MQSVGCSCVRLTLPVNAKGLLQQRKVGGDGEVRNKHQKERDGDKKETTNLEGVCGGVCVHTHVHVCVHQCGCVCNA